MELHLCVGSRQGLVKLLQSEASKAGNNSNMQLHCLNHEENVCAKSLKMEAKSLCNVCCKKNSQFYPFQKLTSKTNSRFAVQLGNSIPSF